MKHTVLIAQILTLMLAPHLSGCAYLNLPGVARQTGFQAPPPPKVDVVSVKLAEAPTDRQLAGYFCSRHAPAIACQLLSGQSTDPRNIRFSFDIELEIENKAQIALPVVSMLVGFKAFPEATVQTPSLGSVCLSMCENPQSCPQQANDCQSTDPLITDVDSFANAAVGFLIRTATGQASFEDLRIKMMQPSEKIRIVTRLSLSADQVLRLMEQTGEQLVNQTTRGQVPEFAIPYEIEGSIWISVEQFGRIGASFPKVQGSFGFQN